MTQKPPGFIIIIIFNLSTAFSMQSLTRHDGIQVQQRPNRGRTCAIAGCTVGVDLKKLRLDDVTIACGETNRKWLP